MPEARTSIRLDSQEQLQQLRQVLAHAGYPERQQSRAFRDIASGELALLRWTPVAQDLLVQAAIALAESSQSASAMSLAEVLEALPLSDANKKALADIQLGQREWVGQVKRLIRDRQPFYLTYHGKLRLCRYAEVFREGDREYIHAWCNQPDGRVELPALAYNRLFRTDEFAEVEPATDAQWRSQGLDWVEAVFQVNFHYREKPEDLEVAPVTVDGETWTRVRQRVTNLLMFCQRIARYGDACQLESPEAAIAYYVTHHIVGPMKRYEKYLMEESECRAAPSLEER